jgi:L-amino acid N-acyltransferase YncA
MFRKLATRRKYPWIGEIRGKKFTFRPMTPQDREATLAFTSNLPHSDILFLQSDITKPEVIDEWISIIEHGCAFVLLAFNSSDEIVGYASLYHNENSWVRHQVEIRIFVNRMYRNTGVGKHLAAEITALAEEQKFDIIVVNVPREHPHIRVMLEKKGFNVEALLTDWLMDTDGKTHDLLVMARRLNDDLT